MKFATPRRRCRRERGEAAIVFLLALMLLMGLMAFQLSSSGAVGVIGEARRSGQLRANVNSLSAITLSEREIRTGLPGILKARLEEIAGDAATFPTTLPNLAGLSFNTIRFSYDPLPGSRQTADDRAEVEAEISLAAPPANYTLGGLPGGSNAAGQEIYTFQVRLRSTGYAPGGSQFTNERVSYAYVAMLTRANIDPRILERLAAGSPLRASNSFASPHRTDPTSPGGGFWDIVPVAHAAGGIGLSDAQVSQVNPANLAGGGGASGGAWQGAPVLAPTSGDLPQNPVSLGRANGNRAWVFYLKGVPQHSTIEAQGGAEFATIQATDDWRFLPEYDRGTDTAVLSNGTTGQNVRRHGSPRYAVAVVQAPAVDRAPDSGYSGFQPRAVLRTPGGHSITLDANDTSWRANTNILMHASSGGRWRAVGIPTNYPRVAHRGEVVEAIAPSPALGSTGMFLGTSEAQLEEFDGGAAAEVRVPVHPNDTYPGGPFSGRISPGQSSLILANLWTRTANVTVRLTTDNGTVFDEQTMLNAQHAFLPPQAGVGGGGGIVVDPPPPGCINCDPPPVSIWGVFYVPIYTYAVEGPLEPIRPGK